MVRHRLPGGHAGQLRNPLAVHFEETADIVPPKRAPHGHITKFGTIRPLASRPTAGPLEGEGVHPLSPTGIESGGWRNAK